MWKTWTSPYHKMFFAVFAVFCNIHWRSFLPSSHLIIHRIQEWSGPQRQFWFCFVVFNDELLCSSLRANNGFPRSIGIFLFFQNDVLVFTRETCLRRSLRAKNGFHHSIIHQFIRLPLLRRPSFISVPFWVACWARAFKESVVLAVLVTCVTANNGFLSSIVLLSLHSQKTLTFITSLLRAFWCRWWHSWGSPCNQTHHWSWLCCDSFFTWFLLRSFWHHFRTICRTEMANVKQTQKMIPFITCEISLS